MTAALVVAVAVGLLAGLGRGGLVATRRGEVRWRVAGARQPAPFGAFEARLSLVASWWRDRPGPRRQRLVAELPDALDEIARALRAGASLPQALADASRMTGVAGADLGGLVARDGRGMTLRDNLERWADEQPVVEVRLAATALALAADTGGHAAQAVESVAATLRERRSATEEVRVQSVQARLSAVVIALLPLGFTAWCISTDPRAASFLLGSAAGWLCLAAGLALLASGGWWMARIVRTAA